jgi:hypothetical protein
MCQGGLKDITAIAETLQVIEVRRERHIVHAAELGQAPLDAGERGGGQLVTPKDGT